MSTAGREKAARTRRLKAQAKGLSHYLPDGTWVYGSGPTERVWSVKAQVLRVTLPLHDHPMDVWPEQGGLRPEQRAELRDAFDKDCDRRRAELFSYLEEHRQKELQRSEPPEWIAELEQQISELAELRLQSRQVVANTMSIIARALPENEWTVATGTGQRSWTKEGNTLTLALPARSEPIAVWPARQNESEEEAELRFEYFEKDIGRLRAFAHAGLDKEIASRREMLDTGRMGLGGDFGSLL